MKRTLLAGLMLALETAFAMGGVVNKGGDTVRCTTSELGPAGYYVLDYALAIGRGHSPADFVRLRDWPAYRDRLQAILDRTDGQLALSFREFAHSSDHREEIARSQIDYAYEGWRRRWRSYRGQPFPVEDVGNLSALPKNCKYKYGKAQGGIAPHFLVYRILQRSLYADRELIVYRYDKQKLSLLRSSLQYAFLMTHEWLWDWTEDVEVNRRVNAFLNSRRIDSMSGADIRATLHRLGLN